jgi:tetratricopeptide (TPR) repeat protein
MQAISGLGGIGKTHTAVEYAYRFCLDYEAVLWLQADSWEILASSCMQLAIELELPEQKEVDQCIAEVQRWLRKHHRWLLILDNVENPQEIISKFVPTHHQGSILITTRTHDVEPLAQTQVLSTMSEQDGILFLLRRTRRVAQYAQLDQASSAQHDEARHIWQLMDGLPLALDQAGSYILEMGCSFSRYQEQYACRRAELLKRRGKRFIGHEESVATTFSLAFERIEALSPIAADLLRVCSFLYSEAIPIDLFRKGAGHLSPRLSSGEEYIDQAISVLQDYSLVHRSAETETLSIHRLVQAVLIDEMDASTAHQWADRVVQAMESILPVGDDRATGAFERLLPHAQNCARLIEQYHLTERSATQLLYRTGVYLAEHVRYGEAEALYIQCLNIRERAQGPEHPEVGYPLYVLAELYREQGKYREAIPLYQQTLRIWRQVSGSYYPELVHPLRGLAELHHMQANYHEAEPLYQEAITILEQTQRLDQSQMTTLLNCLANLYREQGKYAQAESLYQRNLRLYEQTLSKEQPAWVDVFHGLAELYTEQGRYGEAEGFFQQALYIYEQVLDPDHPRIAPLLHNLANLYVDEGKYDEAELLYQRALHILEQAFGPDHHQLAHTLNSLANIYQIKDNHREAEALYQQALRIYEQTVGPTNVQLAAALNNLGKIYQEQGKYRLAEAHCLRALHIREQALGPEHSDVATSLDYIAMLYCEQDKYDEAEVLYQRSLCIREQVLGPSHPLLAFPLNGLGNIYSEQGKYDEAEPFYQRALSLWGQRQDVSQSHLATLLQSMARCYREQGKYREAEPLYQRALRVQEQRLGTDHSDLVSLLNHLAMIHREQGKYAEAESLFRRTLHIQEQTLGKAHPDVAIQLDGLANLYAEQEKYEKAEPLYKRAISIWEQAEGEAHLDRAASLNNLAELYRQQEKYEEAESLYKRAISLLEQTVEADLLHMAQMLTNLAIILSIQGRYGEAELLYLRALHIREQSFGQTHPEVAASLANLATLYYAYDKYHMAKRMVIQALLIVEQQSGPHHTHTIAFQQLYDKIQQRIDEGLGQSKKRRKQRNETARSQAWKADKLRSLQQEHDIQYNQVQKRLSKLIERAPQEIIKHMCSSILHAWKEAVLEESKSGEAFALYGLPPKTTVFQLVPESRISEGRNPRHWTGEGSEQGAGNLYVIEVDQNPFEVAMDDDFYATPLPLNMALRQAFDVTHQRFFTENTEMKEPDNPECRRIYLGIALAAQARYSREEREGE